MHLKAVNQPYINHDTDASSIEQCKKLFNSLNEQKGKKDGINSKASIVSAAYASKYNVSIVYSFQLFHYVLNIILRSKWKICLCLSQIIYVFIVYSYVHAFAYRYLFLRNIMVLLHLLLLVVIKESTVFVGNQQGSLTTEFSL